MTDLVPVKRALISLSDKSGLEELAAGLARHNVEILSTGREQLFGSIQSYPRLNCHPAHVLVGFLNVEVLS